ncbi:AI-2E family transporter [bacterium]|nr:AI-2E family transporter [bacterium]
MIDFFKQHITIKNIIFFIIMILFLNFIFKIKDIAILFFASYVISCSLNPLVNKLSKKINRELASGIVLISGLLIFTSFLIPIIIMGGHQIKSLVDVIPEHFVQFKTYLSGIPFFAGNNLHQVDFGAIVSSAGDVTSNIVTQSINISKNLASGLIYFLAACLIIYYMLADRETLKKGYLSLFPNNMKQKAEDIIKSISQKIGGYVVAQIVTMVSVGFIIFLGLAVLGIDYALILGLITAVFDIIPIIGPAAALVVIILAVYKFGALKIGLVILVFALAQWAENNLVRPYIFSKFMDLHPLIIYFFLFVTAQYLGIIGVVFAPAIAATVCVLIEELYIKSINN